MAYRKFTADNLFTGYEMRKHPCVLVTDEKGTVREIVNMEDAGEGVEKLIGTLSPGFVNCHCHLELSHMKGLVPQGKGIVNFLLSVMGNRNLFSESIADSIEAAEKSMINNGIVAVGDICNTDSTSFQKQQGNIHYHNFIEASGFVVATAGLRFGQTLEVFEKFKGNVSIAPHAPYSVSSHLFGLISSHEHGSLLTIHNQESLEENELFQNGKGDFLELFKTLGIDISDFKKTGKTSLQSYLNRISNDHSMILVHNTVTDQEDIDWVLYNKNFLPELYWCVCPNANLYINNVLPDIAVLMRSGYKMVVGTDSLASNRQLNIIEELKTLQHHFPFLAFVELLKWATVNGAEALRITDTYGSFEKGKRPGVVLIGNAGNGSFINAFCQRIL